MNFTLLLCPHSLNFGFVHKPAPLDVASNISAKVNHDFNYKKRLKSSIQGKKKTLL